MVNVAEMQSALTAWSIPEWWGQETQVVKGNRISAINCRSDKREVWNQWVLTRSKAKLLQMAGELSPGAVVDLGMVQDLKVALTEHRWSLWVGVIVDRAIYYPWLQMPRSGDRVKSHGQVSHSESGPSGLLVCWLNTDKLGTELQEEMFLSWSRFTVQQHWWMDQEEQPWSSKRQDISGAGWKPNGSSL